MIIIGMNLENNLASENNLESSNKTILLKDSHLTLGTSNDTNSKDKLKTNLINFPNNKTYFVNQTNSGILSQNSTENTWVLENNSIKANVHFEIAFNDSQIQDNVNFFLYDDIEAKYEQVDSKSLNSQTEIGEFLVKKSDFVIFILNLTNPIFKAIEYNILFQKALEGYDFDTAIPINSEINSPDQYTAYLESINFNEKMVFFSEYYASTLYFSFKLHSNQRINITVYENTQNILEDARVNVFSPRSNLPPDFITYANETTNTDGEIHTSWVGPTTNPSLLDDFWLEIEIQQLIKGNFTINLAYQEDAYSFGTAKYIPMNSTIIDSNIVDFFDPWNDIRYYYFEVNQSGLEIFFEIKESIAGSGSINNAVVSIFDSGKNSPIAVFRESLSKIINYINGSFYVENPGTYYLVLDLSEVEFQGLSFEISISFSLPEPFIWRIEFILVSIFCLLAIPFFALGYDLYLGNNNQYWDVSGSKKSIYKFISENPRFVIKGEVPEEKIMFILPYYLGTLILEFSNSSEENISISLNSPIKSIFRIFFYLPIGIFIYWILNYLLFFSTRSTALWFYTPDIITLSLVLISLLIITGIPALLVTILRYNYIDIMKKEIEYSITSYVSQSLKDMPSDRPITIEEANKMLSYVRVLWNQAKKAFKEKNYSLFIIKADSAVKKLIELRFLQLMGHIADKLTFEEIIEKLRENAFDVPSSKKIEFFRKVRNKVVHSSHLLEEKTAIETFTYYNKFLSRLGLRT